MDRPLSGESSDGSGYSSPTEILQSQQSAEFLLIYTEDVDGDSSAHSSIRLKTGKTESMSRSKGKLEDQMNHDNLERLQEIFEQADEDCGGGLDIEEFGKAMKMAFQNELDDKQLNMLFMKVDTNCDGTVDWEEFCDYMLLENQQKDSMSRDVNELPFPNTAREIPSPHHDTLISLTYLPSIGLSHANVDLSDDLDTGNGRYVSCSKDGMLVLWNLEFTSQRTILLGDIHSSTNKTRPIWVTGVVSLANVKKLAVSTTERDVSIFDCSGNNFEKQFMITGMEHSVVCMDYWYNPRDLNESKLLLGDMGGGITCILFSEATSGLFDLNIGKHNVLSNTSFRQINFRELLKVQNQSVKAVNLKSLHGDWVKKVKYIPNLHSFISCSSTCTTSLYLGDINRKKMKSYFKVKKGVYTFDYDKDNNVIITGGPDRIIRLWNPYVTNKATSMLKGHLAPIAKVIMDSAHQQIISISKDKMIKVWDMRDQLCIQTIPCRLVDIGTHPITTACYNKKQKTLLIGGNSIAVLEKNARSESTKADDAFKSHCQPLCAALYNDLFNQVVSADHDSVVNVWQLETGEKSIMLKVGPDGVEVTAISFDQTKRRLITGTRDGTVKVWNFNNGACLRKLHAADNCEITGIVCPKQKIVFVGWNQKVLICRDASGAEEEEPKVINNLHKDDIIGVDVYNSSLATTASYDGAISVWSLETGHVYCSFNVNSVKGSKKYQGYLDNQNSEESGEIGESLFPPISRENRPTKQKEPATTSGDQPSTTKRPSLQRGKPGQTQKPKEDLLKHANQHLSVEKVMFLKQREHGRETATLLSSAGGLIQAWSVHGGGLLGQFHATSSTEETVLTMETDRQNLILISGDSAGYLTVWDISSYAVKERITESPIPEVKNDNLSSLIRSRLLTPGGLSSVGRPLNSNKKPGGFSKLMGNLTSKVNTDPPPKIVSFRAHTQSIVSVSYAEKKQLIITASTDCCVRVWNIHGRFVGTFGQKAPWTPPDLVNKPKGPKRVPADIQRIASPSTLKVMTSSSSR
eukprot:gene7565-8403_t